MKTQFGLQAGVGYYLGDLNENKHFKSKHTHFAWGFIHRQPITDRFTWKNSFLIGKISGDDADSELETNRNRNLNFQSRLYEYSSQVEFNFFRHHSFVINHIFSPYVYTGLAFFWFNPTTTLIGNEYTLREYRTEGQADEYKKLQFALPFGVGMKFKFSHRVMFSLEYGLRKTYTDYLDDVSTTYPEDPSSMSTVSQALSNRTLDNGNKQNEWGMQRGNSQRKDLYSFTTFSILIRLGKSPNLCRYNTQ
jgi:opacity protein-like surface antigen